MFTSILAIATLAATAYAGGCHTGSKNSTVLSTQSPAQPNPYNHSVSLQKQAPKLTRAPDNNVGKYCAFNPDSDAYLDAANAYCYQFRNGATLEKGAYVYQVRLANMPDGFGGHQTFWGELIFVFLFSKLALLLLVFFLYSFSLSSFSFFSFSFFSFSFFLIFSFFFPCIC